MLTEAIANAGFSPAGRHAKVPPRQASGHLTSLKRARTCQGSLPDPEEVQHSISMTSWPALFSVHTEALQFRYRGEFDMCTLAYRHVLMTECVGKSNEL